MKSIPTSKQSSAATNPFLSQDQAQPMNLAGRLIGPGQRPLVIAEAGVNHNGQADLAHQLVDAAADAGASAVKFQAFRAEWLVTPDAPRAAYQAANTGSDESQFAMLKTLELPASDFAALKAHCDDREILFLCTPFDQPSTDMLAGLGVAAMKIPSGEVTNTLFLRHLARLGLPLILSTGMATFQEIDQAVTDLREATQEALPKTSGGGLELVVLHCVSSYPAAASEVNLRVMNQLARRLGVATGLSDHTLGTHVAMAAAALGACVIEKHFTLDRTLPGPDHRASLEPAELAQLVHGVGEVHAAMGDGVKKVSTDEQATAKLVRRSLAAKTAISRGTPVTQDMLMTLRPAGGIAPGHVDQVVGRRATRDLAPYDVLQWPDLQAAESVA